MVEAQLKREDQQEQSSSSSRRDRANIPVPDDEDMGLGRVSEPSQPSKKVRFEQPAIEAASNDQSPSRKRAADRYL